MFDITVDVMDGTLLIGATFRVHAKNVDAASTISSDVLFLIHGLLIEAGYQFESIVSSFGTAFDSSAELFSSIATEDRITLLLDANLNAEARLVLKYVDPNVLISTNVNAIQLFTTIKEMNMALVGEISDAFDITIDAYGDLHVTPSVHIGLKVENTATPFDVHQNPSSIQKYRVSGEFEGLINVAGDNFPAGVALQAYSPNLPNEDSLEFVVGLDIDLVPITESECISYIAFSLSQLLFIHVFILTF